MAITVACWIMNAASIILTMGTSGYYVACLNPDLMKDYLYIWVSLLVMGVASVIEFLYFMVAIVMLMISSYSTVQLLTNILRLYDPALQIIGDVGFLVTIILFDPIKGSDDGIFQVIIVFLVGGVKMFLTYTTLMFNYDATYYTEEASIDYANVPNREPESEPEPEPEIKPLPELKEAQKAPTTLTPTSTTAAPQIAIIRNGRAYLVPADNLRPVYVVPK